MSVCYIISENDSSFLGHTGTGTDGVDELSHTVEDVYGFLPEDVDDWQARCSTGS